MYREKVYVHVVVPRNLIDEFDGAAKDLGMTRSEALRDGMREIIMKARKRK